MTRKTKPKDKPIRFAMLIRVSTEKQEQQGESLLTQHKQLTQAVESLGGMVAKEYGGQEHATVGWEREQLKLLLEDAAGKPRPFDAVIVTDPSRWSRDHVKSEQDLEHLRECGVRFFTRTQEHDLDSDDARLFLTLSSVINGYQASVTRRKSLDNRLERAKRGLPAAGKWPFGRKWDSEKVQFVLDPDKKTMIEDVAERYLAGESMPKLAKEYGVNHSNLVKVLRERCGTKWEQTFKDQTTTMTIPALLDAATIKAVRHKLKANRTYQHGKPKHQYLLSGYIFCAACEYAMTGQPNADGRLYYRHANNEGAKKCDLRPRPQVPAIKIEAAVVSKLVELFGNPAAIERAVKSATPDADKLVKQRDKVQAELAKVGAGRERIIRLVGKLGMDIGKAEKQLSELTEQEELLAAKLETINEQIGHIPDKGSMTAWVQEIEDGVRMLFGRGGKALPGGNANSLETLLDLMDEDRWNDRRQLVQFSFGTPLPNGKPAGVYLLPGKGPRFRPKQFKFELRGRLFAGNKLVVPCASYSPAPVLPAPRCGAQAPRPAA